MRLAPSRRRLRGFTLMELMIAVVVIGILAALAYPAYTSMIARGRRADAIAVLTTVVQAQERHRSNRNAYADSFGTDGLNMEQALAAISKYYDVTLTGVGATPSFVNGYVATATPKTNSPQRQDKKCQVLIVKLEGSRFYYESKDLAGTDTTSTENCWSR